MCSRLKSPESPQKGRFCTGNIAARGKYDESGTVSAQLLSLSGTGRNTGEMDLLPDDISEFRSESYWTEFFRKRGNLPFEWYGEWSELEQLVDKFCAVDDSILMVGCGNSDLSGSMYDN